MPFEAPRHVERYRALRGVRVHFSKSRLPELRLTFPAFMLDAPLSPGGVVTRAGGTEQLDRLQRQIGRTMRVREWTRLLLAEAECCQPSAEELAGLLNVSRRTFERALAVEGAHFRALSRLVRHARACDMLRAQRLPIAHIADRLGYGDAAAFSNAFRAMAGCSPSAFRQQQG